MKLLLMALEMAVLTPALLLVKALLLSAALVPAGLLVRWSFGQSFWIGVLSLGPAYYVFGFALMIAVVVGKWAIFYRAVPGEWRFFSFHVACWALTAQFYDLVRFFFLHQVRGTWLFNLFLRALGARIGSNVIINSATVSDWDLISIGDDTLIGDDAVILAHVGEKGLLRMAPVRIGRNCTIGRDTCIMPGVVIEDGAVLAAMSVASKNRVLPAGTVWGGTELHQLHASGGRASAVAGEGGAAEERDGG
jgi:non-ribosomal peptide synthetase-like protein